MKWLPTLLLSATLLVCAGPTRADQQSLRLRVAWGAGQARQWQARFELNAGAFADFSPLAMEADGPGSADVQPQTVDVVQRSPSTYDGFDVSVRAPADAILRATLSAEGLPLQHVDIPLSELVDQVSSTPLDDGQNRLLVRRCPGDRLRVKFDRSSLVFSPGDTFDVEVQPYRTGIADGTTVHLDAQLRRARSDDVVWSTQQELKLDSHAPTPTSLPIAAPLPQSEGVYDLHLTLTKRRLALGLPAKPALRRIVQLVVIDAQRPAERTDTPMKEVAQFDPAHPKSWESLTRSWERLAAVPLLSRLPGLKQGPLSNAPAARREHGGRTVTALNTGNWVAYPLPVERVGWPHVVEVEYPADLPQTLGVSVVEPNAGNRVLPIGLDSGLDVSQPAPGAATQWETHRLTFWPRSKTPFLLLHNQRTDGQAFFGRIRLLAGPDRLAPAELVASSGATRQMLAMMKRPLLPENFSAAEAVDPHTQRSQDDWLTFYQGSQRLVEYLKHVGYGGAMIGVYHDGATVYPSRLLQPTPKYDTGAFFTSGQDPVRKDVLEMLLRMCDREQLRLVPTLQFAAPLPALEANLHSAGPDAIGIRLVDAEGRTWAARHGTDHGLAPYYNPLDPRVQRAMLEVVDELVARYGHHPSFAGLAVQLTPAGFAQLPDAQWGTDPTTLARFAKETLAADADPPTPADVLDGTTYPQWLAWRAEQIAALYTAVAERLRQDVPHATLYLAGADLIDAEPLRQQLQPALPRRADLAGALLRMGIDPDRLHAGGHTVLMQPRRIQSHGSLAARAASLELRGAVDATSSLARSGCVFDHVPRQTRLESFDRLSPWGPENTYTLLVSHTLPAGPDSRRRIAHALAASDVQLMVDGGWMLPLGQQHAMREAIDAFRHLPAEPFTDAPSQPPVIVRTLQQADRTLVYAVNDSPWPVTAQIQLRAPVGARLLAPYAATAEPLRPGEGGPIWVAQLKPYDVQLRIVDRPQTTVLATHIALPTGVVQALRQRLDDVGARAANLRSAAPLSRLSNPGFELTDGADVPGWSSPNSPQVQLQLDTTAPHSGAAAAHLESEARVTLFRSEPFSPPNTGRLSVAVWLRTNDPQRQPPLQLGLEGRRNGQTYYRHAKVGAGVGAVPLQTEWAQYIFQVNDLPLEGLADLRVCFDLVGPGSVWIDDVELWDRSFSPREQNELSKIIALADLKLDRREVDDCLRLLDGYWPRFLVEYIPAALPPMAARPRVQRPAPLPPVKDPSVLDKMKDWVPKLPWL